MYACKENSTKAFLDIFSSLILFLEIYKATSFPQMFALTRHFILKWEIFCHFISENPHFLIIRADSKWLYGLENFIRFYFRRWWIPLNHLYDLYVLMNLVNLCDLIVNCGLWWCSRFSRKFWLQLECNIQIIVWYNLYHIHKAY